MVWAPFVRGKGPTLLLLDSFRVHMMGCVITRLQELGTDVEILPAGCTSAVQPVDNGINKPFKDRIRAEFHAHQLSSFETSGQISTPSRLTVANWISSAWSDLSVEIVKRSWKTKIPFFWFQD